MIKDKNYYDILQVTRDASQEVIRAAYKSLSQKYHPDKNPNNPDAASVMVLVNQAYLILSDLEKRKEYDYWLKEQEELIFELLKEKYATNVASDNSTSNVAQSLEIKETKKVGAWLGIGILFMPYIFAWVTLDKSYSDSARFISFGWFIFVIFRLLYDYSPALSYVWLVFVFIFFAAQHGNKKLDNDVHKNVEPNNEQKTHTTDNKTNRNASCPCGSGKKYKYCCGKLI